MESPLRMQNNAFMHAREHEIGWQVATRRYSQKQYQCCFYDNKELYCEIFEAPKFNRYFGDFN
jgi:hypothetical protein